MIEPPKFIPDRPVPRIAPKKTGSPLLLIVGGFLAFLFVIVVAAVVWTIASKTTETVVERVEKKTENVIQTVTEDPVKVEIKKWIHDNISREIEVVSVKPCQHQGKPAYLVRTYAKTYSEMVAIKEGRSWRFVAPDNH